jgi:phthalate 4,5-cis-dihydrodiol dehydrogenase
LIYDTKTRDPVRLGIIGLGRAFVLMLATFRADDRVRLVAACAPRAQSRAAFEDEFGGRTYDNFIDLCADPDVEAIYIASPHQLHADHAIAAAKAGKHVLVEKPVAVSIDDALGMVTAFRQANLHLVVGPSHSFDAPVLKAREMIDSGEFGRVTMLHALNCTDFLYRPRRPEELRTQEGGGVIFSQGVHQIDVARLLCGQKATQVTAMTRASDPERPTEGAYCALLAFDGGAFASLTYSGYAHFDSDVWQDDVSELGYPKLPQDYGSARRGLAKISSKMEEMAVKQTRTYAKGTDRQVAPFHEHFGPVIVFCEHADLRLTPKGVHVFADTKHEFIACPMRHPRAEVIDALYGAVRENRSPTQSGAWGLASLEICHAILESARTDSPVHLQHQIGLQQ